MQDTQDTKELNKTWSLNIGILSTKLADDIVVVSSSSSSSSSVSFFTFSFPRKYGFDILCSRRVFLGNRTR